MSRAIRQRKRHDTTQRRVVETEEVTAFVETFTSITWLIIAVNQHRLPSLFTQPIARTRTFSHTSPRRFTKHEKKRNRKIKKRNKGFNVQHLSKREITERFNREGNQPPQIEAKFIPGYIPLKEAQGTTIGNYLMGGEGSRIRKYGRPSAVTRRRRVTVGQLSLTCSKIWPAPHRATDRCGTI